MLIHNGKEKNNEYRFSCRIRMLYAGS